MAHSRSSPWVFSVAAGKVPGAKIAFISGRNGNVSAGTPATIWNQGGLYPWSVWDSGEITLYVGSTVLSDAPVVLLSGLDDNYNEITETVTVTGTTYVATTKKFRRLNNALIVSNNHTGTIYIRATNSTGTVVGRIDSSSNQTSMSVYTIPAGYTGFSVFGDFSVNKNEAAELNARWRFDGTSAFITVYAIEVYQSVYSADPIFPGALPEKTDIDNVAAYVTTNGTRVYSNQQLVLIKNDYLL